MTPTPPPLPPPNAPPGEPAGVPPGRPPLDYLRVGIEQRPNTPATAGLICGVLLFVPYVAGIAAILLGRAGRRRADELGGRGRRAAQAAVVLGVINLALAVLLTAASFPARAHARRKAMQIQCMSNMRQLSIAMMMYAQDSRGAVPPNLDVLLKYLGGPPAVATVCTCPEAAKHMVPPASTGFGTKYSYVYVAPPVQRLAQIRSPANEPAVYEPLANHGGRGANVAYWDGHVEWHNAAAAQALIAKIQVAQAALHQAATAPAIAPATRPTIPPGPESSTPLEEGGL